jgi:hypothetical protein
MCRPIKHDGGEWLLGSDMSITCWKGEHWSAALMAVVVLQVVCVMLPCLVYRVRTRVYSEHAVEHIMQPDFLNPL